MATIGFVAPTISWTADLEKDGQSVITFSGLSEGLDGISVNQPWDGKDAAGQTVADGDYTVRVNATACEPGVASRASGDVLAQQEGSCQDAQPVEEPVTVAVGSVLEILHLEGGSGKKVASSKAEFPALVPDPDATTTAANVANYRFVLKPRTGTKHFVVRLVDSTIPDGTDSVNAQVSLSDSESGGIPVTLERKFNFGFPTSVFSAHVIVGNATDPSTGTLGMRNFAAGGAKTYSYLDNTTRGTDGDDTLAFHQENAPDYRLGESKQWPVAGKNYQVTTPSTKAAFNCAGYEDLIARYEGLTCWARVQNQANAYYVSTHGSHDAGVLKVADGYFGPGDATAWGPDLKLMILAGCSVCDVGNFNLHPYFSNNQIGLRFKERLPEDAVLLGYNAAAPIAPTDVPIIRQFYRELAQFSSVNPDAIAKAWIFANDKSTNVDADDACAITRNYYYFIRFKPDTWKTQGINRKRRAYIVHRNHWGKEEGQFEAIPIGPQGKREFGSLQPIKAHR